MPLTHATTIEGYDAIRLRSATAHLDATFVPAAGMVGASLRDGGRELLGRGSGVHCYARGGTTMGIPLLHPWANRLAGDEYRVNGTAVRVPDDSPLVARDEHGLPIHGLLGGSALRRRTLTVRTTLTATGAHPVPVSFGFHPYLRLPDVAREDWQIELPAMRRLELDERSIPTGASRPVAAQAGPLGARTFDDGYVDVPDGAEFVVAGGGRRVTVRLETGYPAAQVFAPATDDVICFEPMTAPTNALGSHDRLPLVAPGERYCAAFSITVER